MSRKFLTPISLPADPTLALEAVTKQYVDARAGSEVEINVSDPIGTNPNAELWYDTDAPTVMDNDMRWYTAWGIVARGSIANSVSIPTGTGAQFTDNVPFTTIVGRQYKITLSIRAFDSVAGVAAPNFFLRDGTSTLINNALLPHQPNASSIYGAFSYSWFMVGDGVARSFNCFVQSGGPTFNVYGNGAGVTGASGLYVEDMGPVAGSLPAVAPAFDRWNTAWGVVSGGALGTTFTTTAPHTTGQNTGLSLTINETAGRYLKITLQNNPYPSGGVQAIGYQVQRNGGVVEQWFLAGEAMGAGASLAVNHTFFVQALGGPATYTVFMWASSVNTAVADYAGRTMTIEDVGPINVAAPAPNPTPVWLPLAPLYQNGWTDYGAPYGPCYYRKVGDIVSLRGLITGGTAGSAVCALPPGYRPQYEPIFMVTASPGGAGSAELRINVNGGISIPTAAAGATPTTWTSLSGVSFSVT